MRAYIASLADYNGKTPAAEEAIIVALVELYGPPEPGTWYNTDRWRAIIRRAQGRPLRW